MLDTVRLVAVMPDAPFGQYLAAGAAGAELDAAVLAGVLEPDGGRLRFSHPLLASAVAGSIPPASLRELHGVAARVVRLPEEQARHRALAATGPSGPVAAELDHAGRTAAGQGAPATAAELVGLAASLTPAGQPADAFRRRLAAARQLAVAVAWEASMVAFVGIIIGVPLGIVLGRWLWVLFAHDIYAVPDPTVPALQVVVVAHAAFTLGISYDIKR